MSRKLKADGLACVGNYVRSEGRRNICFCTPENKIRILGVLPQGTYCMRSPLKYSPDPLCVQGSSEIEAKVFLQSDLGILCLEIGERINCFATDIYALKF